MQILHKYKIQCYIYDEYIISSTHKKKKESYEIRKKKIKGFHQILRAHVFWNYILHLARSYILVFVCVYCVLEIILKINFKKKLLFLFLTSLDLF